MPQQKPVSREEKIADALRAAPPHIAASASVVDYDMTVLREGSSEWTCMPTPPDTPVPAPMCGDQTTMQWFRDWFAGKTPTIDRIGISYMLLGEAGADFDHPEATVPPEGKDWYRAGPHLMMVFPATAGDLTKGIGHDTTTGMPYVRPFRGAQPLLIMPVALPNQTIAWLPEPAADDRRRAGDRYRCTHCDTCLVYEVACSCSEQCGHGEICCGVPMEKVTT